MKQQSDWQAILHTEAGFQNLEDQILTKKLSDYREIPAAAFAWHGWDLLPHERLFRMISPFLRQQVARAQASMPEIYLPGLAGIDAEDIASYSDWSRLPVLVKDDDADFSLSGFRRKAIQNPQVLRPTDLDTGVIAFGSGGSSGSSTPTFVTLADREREIQGWKRAHAYHGVGSGDRALYTYNPAHKGGQWMQESLLSAGVEVFLRRPEEGPLQVLENLRAYGINTLFTVQQPVQAMQRQEKAAGINLHSLVVASLENPEFQGILLPDERGQKLVEFIFLGGFEIVPYALEIVSNYLGETPVATLLGSSEAIPQACSTNPVLTPTAACHHNNLHLLHGPHYIEILKLVVDRWLPVEKGEEGLLVYTTFARDGTIWVRYAPGDLATLLLAEGECPCGIITPVITNVHRKNPGERDELFLTGCAAG